jgi:hypothetical protein
VDRANESLAEGMAISRLEQIPVTAADGTEVHVEVLPSWMPLGDPDASFFLLGPCWLRGRLCGFTGFQAVAWRYRRGLGVLPHVLDRQRGISRDEARQVAAQLAQRLGNDPH